MKSGFKIPRSALVVIYTEDLQVLMLERSGWPGFWQSVTGAVNYEDEPLMQAAAREVREETGLDAAIYPIEDWGIEKSFEIFKSYRTRYAPGVTHNLEHVFGLEVPAARPVRIDPSEHLRYEWLPWQEAAARTISWTNRDAILLLPRKRRARTI